MSGSQSDPERGAVRWGVVVLVQLLAVVACSSEPSVSNETLKAHDIIQLRWIAKDVDRVEVLTQLPPSCESPNGKDADKRMLGRIAFESPALLGGAAARMGLSCSSCHLNGRGNPAFFLDGLSGEAGTADVTSSVLSRVRGDGNFNPKVIPDVGLRNGTQIRDRRSGEFAAKVHGLIEEEFDGQVAPRPVFDAVVAYLDGLDPRACGTAIVPVSVGRDFDAVWAAISGANSAADKETELFYLRAARARLERIYERYGASGQAGLRRWLVSASRWLERRADRARAGAEPGPEDIIQPDWQALRADLAREEVRSFYNPDVLRAALRREDGISP